MKSITAGNPYITITYSFYIQVKDYPYPEDSRATGTAVYVEGQRAETGMPGKSGLLKLAQHAVNAAHKPHITSDTFRQYYNELLSTTP